MYLCFSVLFLVFLCFSASFNVFYLFFLCFALFSFVFPCFSVLFYVFCVFLCSGNTPDPGASRDGFEGPSAYFSCVAAPKQQGHQIASIITTCTRTDEEPCIPGPLCSCTDTALFGILLPAGSSDFGGPPRTYFLFKFLWFR